MKKLILLLTIITGCSIIQNDAGVWSGYVIKKGHHWAQPYEFRTWKSDTIRFDFIIHEDTEYPNLGPGLESDWNKLGYVYDKIHPHTDNSATFVWKWMDGEEGSVLWLGWYGYKNGTSPQENKQLKHEIGIINAGQRYSAEIRCGDPVVFVFEGVEYITPLALGGGRILPPYFGGQATAPHDMHITLIYE